MDDKRVIIEFIKVGAYVKVSAIDPVSSVEVSIVGDPASTQERLKSTVLKKLNSDDFPPTISLRTKSHKLYLTDESFINAIIESRRHLLELL